MTKNELRKISLHRMKTEAIFSKRFRDFLVRKQLTKVLQELQPKSILMYYPLAIECDIRKTLQAFRNKAKVYLPLMDDVSFKMVPFRQPLIRNTFRIYEPRNTNLKIKNIDVAIVPAVGIDGSLGRIGFGKGMYDRFFPTLSKKPFIIFVQSLECFVSEKVCDPFDVRCDVAITSKNMYVKRNINVKRTTSWRRSSSV